MKKKTIDKKKNNIDLNKINIRCIVAELLL